MFTKYALKLASIPSIDLSADSHTFDKLFIKLIAKALNEYKTAV